MKLCRWRSLLVASQICLSSTAWAQESERRPVFIYSPAPVLVLDWDGLLSNTRVSSYVLGGLAELRASLADENLEIFRQLEAEELELAERRPAMEKEEFLKLADDFDQKVRRIRIEQDAKELALQRRVDAARQNFRREIEQQLIAPIMQEFGAVLVLDINMVQVFAKEIDITEEVLARLDPLLDRSLEQTDRSDDSKAPQSGSE